MTGSTGWRRPAGLTLAQPGDIVTIREPDYCYGLGELRLRVTVVGGGSPVHEGAEWVQIVGAELNKDGSERGERRALVRVSALVGQRRMPESGRTPA
jgi:hypothetical protein